MNNLLTHLIILLLYGYSYGQQLTGIVSDENLVPLEFVNVYLKSSSSGTISNSKGEFHFKNLEQGEHKVIVSFVGYASFDTIIFLRENQSVFLNIQLSADHQKLDEYVVSGTMKPISKTESAVPVEVYSTEFFKTNPTPSLFESMQNVNGVRPQNNCNVCNTGDIHINGLEGSYTMILIDGMPLVSGLSTVYGLTGIPQSLIDRVEVVKGPASTLYGSEAIGGLINVITKTPMDAPLFSADVFSSSWGEINTDLGIRFGKKDKFNSLVGVNYFNYKNPIDNNQDGFTDLTLQDRISIFNKWNFSRKDARVFNFAFRYNHENRWGGQMNWTPDFRGGDSIYGESIYTNRWETFGTYQLPLKEKVFFQFSGNGHQQNSVYGNTWYIADQYVGFGQLYWNKVINKHDITSALVYRYTYYDDNTVATSLMQSDSTTANHPMVTHLPGIFIQDDMSINDQSKLLIGMRYDYNSIHGNIFTPRVNFKWSSRDLKNTLRIGGGTGYRVVNVFTEDHAALTGARTVLFEESLSPETSFNTNLNYVHKAYLDAGMLNIDFSGWYTFFTNKIVPDYETNSNQIIYGNLANGNAVSQGVALNVDFYHQSGFKTLFGATLMDVLITENSITQRQILTENFTANFTIGYKSEKLGFSIDYTGKVYSPMRLPLLGQLDNRAAYSPWFSIQNVQLTKTIGKRKEFEVYGGIKNLLNYTPPANSIARAFDPFDRGVTFDHQGNALATESNPNALTFDPAYVYTSNQGIRGFLGIRYLFK